MGFLKNIKNLINKREFQKTTEFPKIILDDKTNDAVWILNNIKSPYEPICLGVEITILSEKKEETITNQTDTLINKDKIKEVADTFMKEISKGPGNYDIQVLENCIFLSEELDLPIITCELILNIIDTQINTLERKGASNHWKEEHTDMIMDLNSLFLTPYTHSKLLGNNEKKIQELRQRIKELDKKYCQSS
ncbi:hypothetical protein KO317_00635 [Candidatus Micrarchaeota archaeon]|nr:hypothetical protein [Candidatus Micrarchaeota archaeon]